MQKIFLLLLFSTSCFCQDVNYNNFSVEDNVIIWSKVFESNFKNIDSILDKNPKIEIINKNQGKATHLKKTCTGTTHKFNSEYVCDFDIDIKDNKYRVRAYNFRFKQDYQITLWNVTSDIQDWPIEEFMLRKSDGKIRYQQDGYKANIKCLDEYLTQLFTITPKKSDW